MRKQFVLLTLGMMLLLSAGAAHPQYYLGVVQGESKKIPLTVLDVHDATGSPALRALVVEVLQDDLRRTQIFEVMDAKKLDLRGVGNAEPAPDVLKRAGTFGLTGVVWVSILKKDQDFVLAGKLYDAASGMRIASKEYFGSKDTFRRAVHAFADEIVARYTGEKGIARTSIAFVSDKTRAKELYVMDYDGQNVMKITADHSICLSPAWSPDGKVLAYVSYKDNNPDLYGLDMQTGKRWKLSGNEGLNISPAWSPNGKRIALALSRDGGTEIYTMNRIGADLERLTYGASDNVAPAINCNSRPTAMLVAEFAEIVGVFTVATICCPSAGVVKPLGMLTIDICVEPIATGSNCIVALVLPLLNIADADESAPIVELEFAKGTATLSKPPRTTPL